MMNNDRKLLIDYLKKQLTNSQRTNYRFRNLGPHSLIYEDGDDKLIVYINDSNLIIIHDGKDVIDNIQMIPFIVPFNKNDWDEDAINEYYLQQILHCF